jgi:hypothetical protein
MNRQSKEKTISEYPDPRWKSLMKMFQGARDTYIKNSPEEFSQTHQDHYDELLDKVIALAEKRAK